MFEENVSEAQCAVRVIWNFRRDTVWRSLSAREGAYYFDDCFVALIYRTYRLLNS